MLRWTQVSWTFSVLQLPGSSSTPGRHESPTIGFWRRTAVIMLSNLFRDPLSDFCTRFYLSIHHFTASPNTCTSGFLASLLFIPPGPWARGAAPARICH